MAATTEITLTDSWVQIVTDGEDFVLQSIKSGQTVYVIYKATAPAESDLGHQVETLGGISSSTFGQGDVYIKGTAGGIVVLTK